MGNERLAETIDRLIGMIEPVAAREGFELVDLVLNRGPKRYLLRVMIDRAGRVDYKPPARVPGETLATDGVSVTDCARVSKLISPLLDVEDLIADAYTLEVSSPGVNRPLRTPSHFRRAVGMKTRVKTRVPVDGESFFIAPIATADDEAVTLDVRGESVVVPYRLIQRANLEFEF